MNPSLKPRRAAFLLNANARSVTRGVLRRLAKLIPRDDLYLSHSLKEAESSIISIIDRGYAYIFCGGGDGTAVLAINCVSKYKRDNPLAQLPKIGILRLGTGNALARFLGAGSPERDIKDILNGKPIDSVALSMIETSLGQQTPFAGIGFDGELMNDFESVKEVFFDSPFRRFFSSVLGYTIAGLFKTLPRMINRKLPILRVYSSKPVYRMKQINGVDEEIYIDHGEVLFEGRAPIICVGTLPSVGYGLALFPFANRRPGYMHLRISAVPIPVCINHLYPSIWHGDFRHKALFDFLVKDVTIESEESLPYQLGGDAMGYKKQIYFQISAHPVAMAALHKKAVKVNLPSQPLMTPLI
ncbi:MAG TPA: diacylglycerol kinase family protein [Myxococcota bacterium]|nr:diacylglycerol kinase family protein [Myxococcota bacterium]